MANATGPIRVAWLDGLRGIAALQVVALHYVSAFLPGIALVDPGLTRFAWESWFRNTPLFILVDGYASVYVFFLISGVALTYAFGTASFAIGPAVARRIVRLGLPMAASLLLAALFWASWPEARTAAGQVTGAPQWLTIGPGLTIGPDRVSPWPLAREILFDGLFLGHAGANSSLLPGLNQWGVTDFRQSFNSPIWSLHLEFYGSLLVMVLALVRATLGRRVHRILCVATLLVLGAHPMGLFAIGHCLAPCFLSPRWRDWTRTAAARYAGCGCLALASVLAAHIAPNILFLPFEAIPLALGLPAVVNAFFVESILEAVLIFIGVACLAGVQDALSRPATRYLGRLSFSVYLVHFPIVMTLVPAIYLAPRGGITAACVVAAAVTAGLAWLFERYVDAPATRLSRGIGRTVPPATRLTLSETAA